MKKIFIVLTLSLFLISVFAQEETPTQEKSSNRSGLLSEPPLLIENQTVATPYKGGLELQIHHRFSLIENIS